MFRAGTTYIDDGIEQYCVDRASITGCYSIRETTANGPLNRHMLNSNSGMQLNPHGTLDIYLQAENPGKEKESNWLPVPQEEYFTLLRVYWPEGDFLTGKWRMPDIAAVK